MTSRARTALTIVAGLGALGVSLGLAARQSASNAAAGAAATAAVASTTQNATEKYEIDPVHSSVVFRISHLGVAPFYATFNDIGGSYSLTPGDLGKSNFDITVKADSVDSRNPGRDRHLKSPDFFNVAEYPEITFKSTKVEASGDDKIRVTGDLTMHGVTKSIPVDMTLIGRQDTGRQGFKSGFEAIFTIKRTDFGMDTYVAEGGLGDEVKLYIGLEGAREEE